MMRSRFFIRTVVVTASVLIAAAVAEGALRVALPRLPVPFLIYLNPRLKDRSPATWERVRTWLPILNLRTEDPDTGWIFKPNMHVAGTNEDGEKYDVVTTGEGFFTPSAPPKSSPQLVVLGDSFLSTFYVPHPAQEILQSDLGLPVYDLAVGGWGPDSYRAAYEKFAADRTHDVVLVCSFLNDITDVLNWNRWKAEESPESFLTWIQRTAPADDSMNRGEGWADTHLVLWNLAGFVLRRAPASAPAGPQPLAPAVLPADRARLERFGDGGRAFDLQFSRGQVFMERDPSSFFPGGDYYEYMQPYLESLVQLKAAIERRHARMALVWIPSKERVYLPLLPQARRAVYVTNHTGDLGGVEAVVTKFAALEGLPLLDLTAPLTEHARAGEKLYFTVDGHFNSDGQKIVGDLMADFVRHLSDRQPADPGAGPPLYYRHGPLSVQQVLAPSAMTTHAAIVRGESSRWRAQGRAESQFGYLARWPEAEIAVPQWLIARGVIHRGGFTLGLLKNDTWALQMNITAPGRFDVAVPVAHPGRYAVLIANALPQGALDTDIEIETLGWARIQ